MRRRRITGSTTLTELQRIVEEAGIRVKLASTRLNEKNEESMAGETLFSVDDLTHFGGPFPSRTGVLTPDLAEALDDAVNWEISKGSQAGRQLLRLLDDNVVAVPVIGDEIR